MKKFLLLLIAMNFCNYIFSQVIFNEEFLAKDSLKNWNNVDLTNANPVNGKWKQAPGSNWGMPTATTGYAYFVSSTNDGNVYINDNLPENGALSNKTPFSCSGINNVFISFYEVFELITSADAVAYVEVSSDGTNWNIISQRDTFVSDNEKITLNATKYLANKPTCYVRFRYKGNFAGVWRVDDLVVLEPNKHDIAAIFIDDPSFRQVGQNQKFDFIVKNNGSDTIKSISTNLFVNGTLFKNYKINNLSIPPLAFGIVTLNSDWNPLIGFYKVHIETDLLNGTFTDEGDADNETPIKNITIYETSTKKRKPLYEVFTSSTCGPCNPGNANFHKIVDTTDQNSFVAVKYQQNYPGTGDPYNTKETVKRARYYSINSIPRMELDGEWNENANSFTSGLHNYYRSVPSIVDLSGTFKYDSASKTINYDYQFKPLMKLPSGLTRLYVAIVEKSTTKNVKSNKETIFYNVVKKMLPDTGIILKDSSLTANKITYMKGKFTIPGNYKLPATGEDTSIINVDTQNTVENPKNLYVVVWAQQNDSKLVLQSEKLTALVDTVVVPPSIKVNDSVFVIKYDTVKVSSVDLTQHYKYLKGNKFDWSVEKVSINSPWTFLSVCDNTDCYNAPITGSKSFIAKGDSVLDNLKVTIDHKKSAGYGYVILKIVNNATPSYTKFSLLVKSTGSSVAIVSPVNEKLLYYFDNTIFVDEEYRNATLNVFDMNGKLVKSNKIENSNIEFDNFAKGIYLANIVKDGELLKTLKFDTSK